MISHMNPGCSSGGDEASEDVPGTPADLLEAGTRIVDGALRDAEDRPVFLLTADYPYSRDAAENWPAQLDRLARAGVRYLTAYVPWRHHAPEDPLVEGSVAGYDFSGESQANRDLLGFLELCRARGLGVVLKPGPHINAELQYGGLPDYVNPLNNPLIEAERNHEDDPFIWLPDAATAGVTSVLPSPSDARFDEYVAHWLGAFSRQVLRPNLAPEGPVLAVQVGNEGIFGDTSAHLVQLYDHSTAGQRAFRAFLEARYGSLEAYNRSHGAAVAAWAEVATPRQFEPPESAGAALRYMDWSEWISHLHAGFSERLVGHIRAGGAALPAMVNPNPGSAYFGLLSQNRPNEVLALKILPELTPSIGYGYTNRIGDPSTDLRRYRQYLFVGTLARGINQQENWAYGGTISSSWFQTLLYMAAGATGANFYTAVGASAWHSDPHLDDGLEQTAAAGATGDWPPDAPLGSNGLAKPRFHTMRQFLQVLHSVGDGLATARPVAPVAWGVYAPWGHAGAWSTRHEDWEAAGLQMAPRWAHMGVDGFLEDAIRSDIDAVQVSLTDPATRLADHRMIVTHGADYLDPATADRLVRYVEGGGALVWAGPVPTLDRDLQTPSTALQSALFPHDATLVRVRDLAQPEAQDGTVAVVRRGTLETLLARDRVFVAKVPDDAVPIAFLPDLSEIGYARPVGGGHAIYLGWLPWAPADPPPEGDPELAAANAGLLTWLADTYAGGGADVRDEQGHPSVEARAFEEAGRGGPDRTHLFVLSRAGRGGRHRILLPGDRAVDVTLAGPGAAYVVLEEGKPIAGLVKGAYDGALPGPELRQVAPRVAVGRAIWEADAPCDLAFAPSPTDPTKFTVSVSAVATPTRSTGVRTPGKPSTARVDLADGGEIK